MSYGLHLTIKQAMSKLGDVATKAILKEMDQMISNNIFHPVLLDESLKKDRRSFICCLIFLKEKYKADGSFDKVKARLVAGGHQQDRTVYGDKLSSPTVAISSVFMISVIAAAERREVVTLDIPAAYMHAKMPTDCAAYMRLNKYLSNIIIQLSSHYAMFLNDVMKQLLSDWTKLYMDAYKVRSYGMTDYVKYCVRWGILLMRKTNV